MYVVVISDTHGNIRNVEHVMGFADKIKATALIHCGDWHTLETVEKVASYNIPIYSVLGNADINPLMAPELTNRCKKFDEIFLKFTLKNTRIGVVHNIKDITIDNSINIIFTGHIHSQKEWKVNKTRIIRPGALEDDISFAVYDIETGVVKFITD